MSEIVYILLVLLLNEKPSFLLSWYVSIWRIFHFLKQQIDSRDFHTQRLLKTTETKGLGSGEVCERMKEKHLCMKAIEKCISSGKTPCSSWLLWCSRWLLRCSRWLAGCCKVVGRVLLGGCYSISMAGRVLIDGCCSIPGGWQGIARWLLCSSYWLLGSCYAVAMVFQLIARVTWCRPIISHSS